MSLQIDTAQNVGVDYEIASIGDRILAQVIDYAIYFGWILTVTGLKVTIFPNSFSDTWMLTGLIMLPIMLYPLLCEYFLDGQTVGKMALKIKVIRLDGNKATLSAYLLRWLLAIIDVTLFSGVVAILTIAITGKGQRLGDLAAGTAVIKTQSSISLDHIMTPSLSDDYKPRYPEVVQLSDNDIRTLKKVLDSNNEELMETSMRKIESLLRIYSLDTGENFLRQIISDYYYHSHIQSS
ncbi:MAG TPA: RDD family protein [Dyadobacter sp.]|jgi:uncharacterized RDD family membrane protein YckC|nr:RDD family protein [Dyadobacter sp.]